MIADSNDPTPDEHQNDEEIWDKYEQESLNNEDKNNEMDPWGGSQYESDPMDEAYIKNEHIGLMQEHHNPYSNYYEQLGMMGDCTENERSDREDSQSIQSLHSLEEIESIIESEGIEVLNISEFIRTMKPTKDDGFIATQEPVKKRAPKSEKRPVKAFALFDSGSTADAISPDFAWVAHLQTFQLENPVQLQLGTKGSRSQITYGCLASYWLNDTTNRDYFDIANIDRYDVVLGTVFMRRHGVILDFEKDTVKIRGNQIPTLTEREEVKELTRWNAKNIRSGTYIKEDHNMEVKRRPNKYAKNVASTEKPLPPWKRNTEMTEITDEDQLIEKPGLSHLLPVLLSPEDEITIEDMEQLIDRVTTGKFSDPNYNRNLHETDQLMKEFFQAKEIEEQKPTEPLPKTQVVEALKASANLFAQRVSNESLFNEQGPYTDKDIPRLRSKWIDSCKDIMSGVPERMPPLREINHTIPLIDEKKKYRYYLPRCPDSLRGQLAEKIAKYVRAGWWKPMNVQQAAPMLCIPKKDGTLRVTIDYRERNLNTEKDVTPLPDQDQTHMNKSEL
ncbi:hypothetical protein F5890DRAFT_1558899 [Lentinula detonsa]|uniref:Uncharacterized protein n=1 Tax=Lentinula detonsa TaxID=2804962 RepID=A0AA38PPP9_9AGAR|nr:hypothetical protein F5890DRAFT_1558899 [Lentinula detonsa]